MTPTTLASLRRWGISPDAAALLEAEHGDLLGGVVAEIEPVATAHGSAVDAALVGWFCREVEAGRGGQIDLEALFAQRSTSETAGPSTAGTPAASSTGPASPGTGATRTRKRWIALCSAAALALVLVGVVAVVGSQSTDKRIATDTASSTSTDPTHAGGATDALSTAPTTPTTSAIPALPAYRLLSEGELAGALLRVVDLPAGYSQDPPVADSAEKTFCDYRPPFDFQARVRRDFTKGGGLSAEALSVGLRQFASPDEASAAFDALTDAVSTCTGETYQGSHLTYAPMSAPEVGDASLGVKINADGSDLLQFFALVGPTIVNTGGGGLMNASVEEVTSLLVAQVNAYEAAATQ